MVAVQHRFGLRIDAFRLPQVKFLQPLLPDQTAEIVLERANMLETPVQRVRFRVERDGAPIASGELIATVCIATNAA